ncbi:MAG TPA: LysM peptidoglycan-binding domain-containing protein [Acidobacteriaceae bacterium]
MVLDPRWTATVDDGLKNAEWDKYDETIKREVAGYNQRLGSTTGYTQVDWKLLKAVLWVESGGPTSREWNKKVMQIGNPGDAAYGVLKRGAEGSQMVMSTQLWEDIRKKDISDPTLNIRAAVAYVFTRLGKFTEASIEDPSDAFDHTYIVASGDSLWSIAHKVGTTQLSLKARNPGAGKAIHPKQKLVYRRASMQLTVSGWRDFTTANIATYYNGGGDAQYAAKLNYVLDLFKKVKR